MTIQEFVKTLEPSRGTRFVQTLDFDSEDGLEATLWAIRFRKKDKEPLYKKAFIDSEKRRRINSDLYFSGMGGWIMLFENRTFTYYGAVHCRDELYETDSNAPGISSVERLWDINDLHNLVPETKYFDSVPCEIIRFIKLFREYPEVEFVWKDKDLRWHWADKRIYQLKNKKLVIKMLKANGGQLNDALGIIKYKSAERMKKERAIKRWRKKLAKYKINRENLANYDAYFEAQCIDLSDYIDYLDLCLHFRRKIGSHGVLFPREFKIQHDNLVKRKQAQENAQERKSYLKLNKRLSEIAKKYIPLAESMKKNDLALVIPTNVEQFIEVGEKLEICVGTNGYDKKMVSGQCLIMFVYKNNKPLECCELKPLKGNQLKLIQLRGKDNQPSKQHEQAEKLINHFIQSYRKNTVSMMTQ